MENRKNRDISELRKEIAKTHEERDALQKSLASLGVSARAKYRFIDDHVDVHDVIQIARALGIARSGYYAWQKKSKR